MSAPTIIVACAGAKTAVRVVPPGHIDRDRAFGSYSLARAYAEEICDKLGDASIDDLCRPHGGKETAHG